MSSSVGIEVLKELVVLSQVLGNGGGAHGEDLDLIGVEASLPPDDLRDLSSERSESNNEVWAKCCDGWVVPDSSEDVLQLRILW